jgi:hypothetical protein
MSRATAEELAFGKARERLGAELLAEELWPGSTVIECATYAEVDFAVSMNGKLVGYIEVKARRNVSSDFEDTLVTWSKHDTGRFVKKFFKVRTVALVIFTDTAGYFYLDETPDGRRPIQRRDRLDQPPVEHALYRHERMVWAENIKKRLDERLEAQETAEATEN